MAGWVAGRTGGSRGVSGQTCMGPDAVASSSVNWVGGGGGGGGGGRRRR